jgi:excisionase family DNA binding protein
METTRLLYSRREAATALSLGVRTLDQLILAGIIPVVRVGRRVLISRDSLLDFAASQDRPPEQNPLPKASTI